MNRRRIELSTGMSTSDNTETVCGLPVLDDLEIVLRQVADGVALRVGDDGVDLDVVDLDPEGHRRLARVGLRRRGGLLGGQADGGQERGVSGVRRDIGSQPAGTLNIMRACGCG